MNRTGEILCDMPSRPAPSFSTVNTPNSAGEFASSDLTYFNEAEMQREVDPAVLQEWDDCIETLRTIDRASIEEEDLTPPSEVTVEKAIAWIEKSKAASRVPPTSVSFDPNGGVFIQRRYTRDGASKPEVCILEMVFREEGPPRGTFYVNSRIVRRF